MKYVIIIPARGGSKGIKKKNLQKLDGKPLLEYTFDAAKLANITNEIYLTSDDLEMIELAKDCSIKVPFIRPAFLSSDSCGMVDVVSHMLEWIKTSCGQLPDNFILLQPTSPFRDENDIIQSVEKYEKCDTNSLFSACEVIQHPFEMFCIDGKNKLDFFYKKNNEILSMNRQEYKKVYFEDGSIYICNTQWFLSNKTFFDATSSIYEIAQSHAIDIDTPEDLEMARAMKEYKKNKVV